ncbi:MAG: division/cell wall cluster transcriptional repressor MraZ [Candidatus Zambryskibacteria bacterium]|nr:division/cell wall cluster transcriptional repressor MraZ [Candidatus Zambryskibacteria bacterium]
MLIGEYTHNIDNKNRVSLPSKFRLLMGKKIVITPGLDQCLFAFTLKDWERIADKLSENSSMLSSDMRSFTRYMFGGASEIEVDSIGRVLVPDFLARRANLKTKVVLIGVQNRLEIWNEKSWTDYKKEVEKKADSLAEKLSDLGLM